ncbi:MAG TPA: hypothetical protein VMX54_01180 [Vicinamibacteria bacterium]|nr:hypothetical protein [Vicinamibacteria bacterium]
MDPADAAETFWLNFTHFALLLATLLCVLVVAVGVVRELQHRLARGEKLADDHAFDTPGLGVTMADGGKRIDRD